MKKLYIPFLLIATLVIWNSGQAHSCLSRFQQQMSLMKAFSHDFAAYQIDTDIFTTYVRYQPSLNQRIHQQCSNNSNSPACQGLKKTEWALSQDITAYRADRNKIRHDMIQTLNASKSMFDHRADAAIDQFLAFDNARYQTKAALSSKKAAMAMLKAYGEHESKLMDAMQAGMDSPC